MANKFCCCTIISANFNKIVWTNYTPYPLQPAFVFQASNSNYSLKKHYLTLYNFLYYKNLKLQTI